MTTPLPNTQTLSNKCLFILRISKNETLRVGTTSVTELCKILSELKKE